MKSEIISFSSIDSKESDGMKQNSIGESIDENVPMKSEMISFLTENSLADNAQVQSEIISKSTDDITENVPRGIVSDGELCGKEIKKSTLPKHISNVHEGIKPE